MKITMAQTNTVVGDVRGNLKQILDGLQGARAADADLIVFHEMCLSGYPPRDLVERLSFIAESRAALDTLVDRSREFKGLGILVGLPVASEREGGKGVANAAVLVSEGEILHVQEKSLLPTYDVFDEARYFDPAVRIEPVDFKGERLGISICEDAWNDSELFGRRSYDIDPISALVDRGATILINISASPFAVEKEAIRHHLVRHQALRHGRPFVLVNQVGGNDELVFDGRSLFVDAAGNTCAALPMFEEAVETIDTSAGAAPVDYAYLTEVESIYGALVLGTRDYLRKCGFADVVLGLSGGIDSAVTMAVAVEAVGRDHVLAIAMPSPHSSRGSVDDATVLARNLGVELKTIEIGGIMASFDAALAPAFAGLESGVTEENLQARIRGNLLMAHSNKFGHIVLSTGNKSELAVGYCTLYGDMSGGLAVISDVPKTRVYQLAEYINRNGSVIPNTIIEKAPSAELRPDQKDSDSLPAYVTLDAILDLYIEEGRPRDEIVSRGHDPSTVDWVLAAVRQSEYKRRQAAPGLKVTSKAFGAGRRFPIASRHDV